MATLKPLASGILVLGALLAPAAAQEIQLAEGKADPYGWPRPGRNEKNVPVETSFYFLLTPGKQATNDVVLSDSVAVRIGRKDSPPVDMMLPGKKFTNGYTGKTVLNPNGQPDLVVYIDGGVNNETRVIPVDDNGDGKKDRQEIVAEQILNFLALVSAGEKALGGQGTCCTPEQAARLRELSTLKVTRESVQKPTDGALDLSLPMDANGATLAVLTPIN